MIIFSEILKGEQLNMKDKFVTAKLKGQIDPRQGWVISENPLLIQGESGVVYECEGEPRLVVNSPSTKKTKGTTNELFNYSS